MPPEPDRYVVDFPTLWVVPAWIERHCVIPDGFRKGRPFTLYDWQLWCTVNHYRIREDARQDPAFLAGDPDAMPVRSEAFYYRRSQVIAPQKTGKGPWSATIVAAEAVGPVLFLDWAVGGEVYRCADYGCGCGWEYAYEAGEPMGHPWATALIQLLATSEDQVDNVYRPLQAMARGPMLRDRMRVREGFIRVVGADQDPDANRIDAVTSSAMSRLGNPINFYLHDESQLYTETNKVKRVAQTMRRGCAAMGGRGLETTNCFDPAEQSTAQETAEGKTPDVFRFYEPPPGHLRFDLKVDRMKILRYNYAGSPHADLHGIAAETEELIETDPGQAERFYGNRIVPGLGAWMRREAWDQRRAPRPLPGRGTPIVLGFDGSDVDDWTGIRAETRDGYQFTPVFDGAPTWWNPEEHAGQVPRLEVAAAIDWLFGHYNVVRLYADPPDWKSELDAWAEKYGEKRVIRWSTFRTVQMHDAAQRIKTDVLKADSSFTHDGCKTTGIHVANTKMSKRPGGRYVLTKPGGAGRKIDLAVVSVLAHEAAGDVTAASEWPTTTRRRVTVMS